MKKTIAQLKEKVAKTGPESLTASELEDLKKIQRLSAQAPTKTPAVNEEFCTKCGIMIIANHDTYTRNEKGQIICELCEQGRDG